MNRSDYLFALSEREQITNLLKKTSPTSLISRISLESRLKKIDDQLANVEPRVFSPTKATITFKGPTVIGTHGISASFGSKAIGIFNDAVSYVASAFLGSLPSSGKVPKAQDNGLMITASARGSFGFVLEEFCPDSPLGFDEETLVSKALNRTQSILQASINGDDDLLTESIEDLDSRAIDKIRSFIHYLNENKTIFTLKHNDSILILKSTLQLEKILEKLNAKNIHEEKIEKTVIFLGTLPNKRQCEFVIIGDTAILTAKIDNSVIEPDIINKHLGVPVKALFTKLTIGAGKPRYILTKIPELDN
ncbi:hypothetical protein ACS90Y_000581 [Yersinia enterocolitica]|uniref:hypothetical protein n=1 Tax=Yersinia enterocolitica TaxID=630 RepID=UPI0028B363B1|nr:hypothetical protein [Yersinia enterocolitica]ELI8098719.1 hypothetical protein [Yersinia enterocolitica]